jgi:hypothetical protein
MGGRTMQHPVVSQEEWLVARKALLSKEKEFTRLRDQLSAERRELPWVKVDKEYVFDGPEGKENAPRSVRGAEPAAGPLSRFLQNARRGWAALVSSAGERQ